MQFELPANRMPKECTCKLKLLLFSCARWASLAHEMITSLLEKLTLLAGIIKQLFGQLLARYLIYLARKNQYWAQLMLRPISALPCQINEISDSSQPNNCIIFLIHSVRCTINCVLERLLVFPIFETFIITPCRIYGKYD